MKESVVSKQLLELRRGLAEDREKGPLHVVDAHAVRLSAHVHRRDDRDAVDDVGAISHRERRRRSCGLRIPPVFVSRKDEITKHLGPLPRD